MLRSLELPPCLNSALWVDHVLMAPLCSEQQDVEGDGRWDKWSQNHPPILFSPTHLHQVQRPWPQQEPPGPGWSMP